MIKSIILYFEIENLKKSPINTFFLKTIIFLVIVSLWNCGNQNSNNKYQKDSNGNYYQLIGIGDGKINPKASNFIILDTEVKTQEDSVIFNSKHNTTNGFVISLSNQLIKENFNDYFFKLAEGDSSSFLIPPTLFFKSFFDTIPPDFCKKDSIIKFNFKLNSILTITEYKEMQNKKNEDNELLELKLIDQYLKANYPKVKPNSFGIYELEKTKNTSINPKPGDKLIVSYQGFFLDGKPLDASPQQIEFHYGTPDQFIKGLNIVIGSLKKGEFSKIIVPSRLAFGELGSSNQLVQPYTPLVYKITLIDIK